MILLKRWLKRCLGAAALLACALAASAQKDAAIEGRILFEGAVPKNPLPDDAGERPDLVRVDGTTKGLQDVVVYFELPARTPAAPPMKFPDVKMDQVNHRFEPRVLAVRSGQPVVFTNSDPANHNVRTASVIATNEFNVFTGIEGSYRRAFAADPKNRPVKVGCDIHPWMRGWIYVFDHPFFAITGPHGTFRIPAVPPGQYQLHIVQPDLGHREQRAITIRPGEICKLNAVLSAREIKRP